MLLMMFDVDFFSLNCVNTLESLEGKKSPTSTDSKVCKKNTRHLSSYKVLQLPLPAER